MQVVTITPPVGLQLAQIFPKFWQFVAQRKASLTSS
jgi:hypothetical protein